MIAFSHHPAPRRDSSGSTQSNSVCLFIFVNVLSSIMRHFITTNKASGSNGIPTELFQILEDDAVTVLYSICQQIWKTQQWPQHWERSVFIPVTKKGHAKECSDYRTIALISHTSKVMLQILQSSLQQSVNRELPYAQARFRKRQRKQRSNCQHPLNHRKSKRVSRKHIFLLY